MGFARTGIALHQQARGQKLFQVEHGFCACGRRSHVDVDLHCFSRPVVIPRTVKRARTSLAFLFRSCASDMPLLPGNPQMVFRIGAAEHRAELLHPRHHIIRLYQPVGEIQPRRHLFPAGKAKQALD